MTKVIEVHNLYKKFIIDTSYRTAFDLFKRVISHQKYYMEIWALKDINLEVYKGDRVGLIGDNGSGKTTLLRIIAGLYKKTEGIVNVREKMAAFLQLGIGMERDLSALENIFLFGAIMGLGRKEIKRKLDDIVEFAEIQNFLHCPIRDFSTGMVQRLTFSIGRHVKADILLLDEMLTSSDTSFKKKCYEVFGGYLNISKTIILASHEMEIIKKFCNKILLLDKGNQIAFGPIEEVLELYTKMNKKL